MPNSSQASTDQRSRVRNLRWAAPAASIPRRNQPALADLLEALQLLGTEEDRLASAGLSAWKPTPESMQSIRSGVLGVTRSLSKWLGIGGLATSGATAAAAVVAGWTTTMGTPVVVTLVAAAALLLVGTMLSLSIVVASDIHARSRAAAARHDGRAQVAAAFLNATASMPACEPPSAGVVELPKADSRQVS